MKDRMQNLTISDYLFLAALVFWMCAYFCYERTFLAIYLERYVWYINFLTLTTLIAAEIMRQKHGLWSLAGFAVVAFCSFAAMRAGTNVVMIMVLFVYVGRRTDFRITAFVSLIVIALLTISIIGLSQIGLLPNHTPTGERTRQYLGFRYPLYPAQCVFMITCLWSYLRGIRISFAEIALLFAINLAIYYATDSRLSFFLSIGLLFVVMVLKLLSFSKHFPNWTEGFFNLKPAGIILSACFILCAAISIAFTAAYDPSNDFIQNLNTSLGGRLQYGYKGLTEYGIPWAGQFVDTNGNGLSPDGTRNIPSTGYFYIDCLYVLVLVRYGFVFFVAFVGSLTAACWYAWKSKQGFMLIALIFIALHCVIDDLSLYIFFNPFLILCGVALTKLLEQHNSKKEKSELAEIDSKLIEAS